MKAFLGDHFLLETSTAQKLYHDYAAKMPIIDYHNHLSPKDIAENRVFNSLTEAWLEGDHYKWRAMRANGVDESYITGDQSDADKFAKWAETVPATLRNPLYHWTHLELRRYFGINELLNEKTGGAIYEQANGQITSEAFSCKNLLKKMNVEVVCTTDDPADSLEYHLQLKNEGFEVKVLPTFRPDKLYAVQDPVAYKAYLKKLEHVVGFKIETFDDLLRAAWQRVEFFHEVGGRLSDHGLEQLDDVVWTQKDLEAIFVNLQKGKMPSEQEVKQYRLGLLTELCKMYHSKGWAQQFHLGAIRNNSERMMRQLGPDTGYDSIGDFDQVKALSKFLNKLDDTDQLTKTILYNLNPRDNETFATMVGNFQDGRTPGKMQFGSGWWFLDQKDGMERQMNALSNMGLLSRFVGMLTDSRSFLSFPRHEYFRRILCNLIGNDVENGELPDDIEWLGGVVEDICYHNARNYFNF